MDYIATAIILMLCVLGLSLGMILSGKPYTRCCEKRPEKRCTCDDENNPCEDRNKTA